MTTPDRQALVDQLIRHEGLRLKPYVDTAQKITIGVGRNLTDVGISAREAMDLLDHDLDACITDLAGQYSWFVTLDAVRQRAVVDLRFNVGPHGFAGFVKFIAAMQAADYQTAAREVVQSALAPGRAQDLAAMLAQV